MMLIFEDTEISYLFDKYSPASGGFVPYIRSLDPVEAWPRILCIPAQQHFRQKLLKSVDVWWSYSGSISVVFKRQCRPICKDGCCQLGEGWQQLGPLPSP